MDGEQITMGFKGQARKSLWIETEHYGLKVHLCPGQARKSLWIETNEEIENKPVKIGQARKSLWIETYPYCLMVDLVLVRLVRACGSKHNQQPKYKS